MCSQQGKPDSSSSRESLMIDDKAGISAAAAKSHKQVIWDLQAPGCLSHGRGGGIISPPNTKGCASPQHPKFRSHTNANSRAGLNVMYTAQHTTPAHAIGRSCAHTDTRLALSCALQLPALSPLPLALPLVYLETSFR